MPQSGRSLRTLQVFALQMPSAPVAVVQELPLDAASHAPVVGLQVPLQGQLIELKGCFLHSWLQQAWKRQMQQAVI